MRWYVKFFIGLGLLLLLYVLLRFFGVLGYYKITTPSSLPTVKVGENRWTTNIIRPNRFDYIAFSCTTNQFGEGIYAHRLVGLPGDELESKMEIFI